MSARCFDGTSTSSMQHWFGTTRPAEERMDTRRDYGEVRYQTIGRIAPGVLFVVYTLRTYEDGKLVQGERNPAV